MSSQREITGKEAGEAIAGTLVQLPASRYQMSKSKALELFALKGFGQVSMRDLASHLGLTAGSLYHHFPSKQHLLFELLEEFYEDLGTILDDCMRAHKNSNRALSSFISARLAMHQEYPFHSRLVQRESISLEGDHRLCIENMRKSFEDNLMRLFDIFDCGLCAKRDAAGHVIAQMIIVLPDWLGNHPVSSTERSRVVERLIMGAVKGFDLHRPT